MPTQMSSEKALPLTSNHVHSDTAKLNNRDDRTTGNHQWVHHHSVLAVMTQSQSDLSFVLENHIASRPAETGPIIFRLTDYVFFVLPGVSALKAGAVQPSYFGVFHAAGGGSS
jgi:hypothetical protein